jgi:hypothetical protein
MKLGQLNAEKKFAIVLGLNKLITRKVECMYGATDEAVFTIL